MHLTWESEAHLEVQESGNQLEIVYPPIAIRAEPKVAVVDQYARRRGTEELATQFLKYLYTPEGQEIIAKNFYRPVDEATFAKHAATFPAIELFAIDKIAAGWGEAPNRILC